jgi:acetyl esterase/lipase
MDIRVINISEEYGLDGNATLTAITKSRNPEVDRYNNNLDAMIVVPGGGYQFVSEREADPIAFEFLSKKYNAFVLRYNVAPYRFPLALTQLACSVDYIKKHAKEFGINPDRIFVCGFSAGGHLCGCLANFWSNLPQDYIAGKDIDAKIKGVVLSYPVIHNCSHIGSFKNLLGIEDANCPEAEALSLEKSVNDNNPPCFIWTTATDACVDPMATVYYTAEYLKRKIKIESHIFPTGQHGGATCDEKTNGPNCDQIKPASCWFDLADRFLQSL